MTKLHDPTRGTNAKVVEDGMCKAMQLREAVAMGLVGGYLTQLGGLAVGTVLAVVLAGGKTLHGAKRRRCPDMDAHLNAIKRCLGLHKDKEIYTARVCVWRTGTRSSAFLPPSLHWLVR